MQMHYKLWGGGCVAGGRLSGPHATRGPPTPLPLHTARQGSGQGGGLQGRAQRPELAAQPLERDAALACGRGSTARLRGHVPLNARLYKGKRGGRALGLEAQMVERARVRSSAVSGRLTPRF
jgi:hypothetical protein